MSEIAPSETRQQSKPRWQAVSAIDRRVLGVLVEKAKTTPDVYPMTLNSITTACNQKSNREPVMQLEPEQIADALERLRGLGAVGLIEGQGRVDKYRHYLYEWLGVDKVELAVMAELLLRGDQTEGELRARASRMEAIRDLPALRPILESLAAKGLLVSLTPEGRGHAVTHALYMSQEMERLKARYAGRVGPAAEAVNETYGGAAIASGSEEIGQLRSEVDELRHTVQELGESLQALAGEFRQLKEQLGA